VGEITVNADHAPLNARVKFMDSEGNETQPDETPEWSSTDESVATVSASDDGLSATVEIGSPGAAVIEVSTVEQNTGQDIIAQGTVTVQPGDTAIGSVDFDEEVSPEEGETPVA
jgi:hypothetical protein